MIYKFIISYPDGKYHLWNATKDNEWEVVFEYEEQMLNFMRMLLEYWNDLSFVRTYNLLLGITFYHSYRCDIWDTQRRNKYNYYLLYWITSLCNMCSFTDNQKENELMPYKIEPIYVINYEVHDDDGKLMYNDRGDNVFETKEEAEKLVEELKREEA